MPKILLFIALFQSLLFSKEQTIVLGAGCFWGVEKHFENLEGVKEAISGYAGGEFENPSYKKVLDHRSKVDVKNYAEVVKVVYDDENISTREILEEFWQIHDPTQKNRQGNDYGNNYRSAIYYTTNKQKEIAFKTRDEFQKLLNEAGYSEITTEIEPLKKFYKAESYHQDYLKKHPFGYCPNHATGVVFKKKTKDKSTFIKPLGAKEIVVVDAKDCPFCKKFKKDVIDHYKGSLPLRVAKSKELKGFKLKGEIVGTPTILFIKDAKEIKRYTGYLSAKEFYERVGAFKVGEESEAYKVAFAKNTDGRFCKQYKIFAHTPDGVFVDKFSGDVLFDTRDRFNSGSGWLSFFKPAKDDSVIFREDNSFGMRRVEVIAKKSRAHLGHVFDDAPGGRKRFCINATVLEFIPRDKIKK